MPYNSISILFTECCEYVLNTRLNKIYNTYIACVCRVLHPAPMLGGGFICHLFQQDLMFQI